MHGKEHIYLSNFGLEQNPFAVTPDPRFFMRSQTHLDALAALIYGIKERKGFISLVGQVGTGKTTLVNTLLSSLDLDVVFSHVIYSDLSFMELLQAMCADFGIAVGRQSKVELMNELFDFLVENRLRGKNALVVIDESQNLSPEVLESIRMLSNFETSREKLIQILLCGQPELKALLKRNELRQLAQRIVVNAELSRLTERECERYVYHRLSVAGADGTEVFPPQVTARIAELSKGIPRIINILCDNCLMRAYAERASSINEKILADVEQDYFNVYNPDGSTEEDMEDLIEEEVQARPARKGMSFLRRDRKKDRRATAKARIA
jgi:general secretion pathway protein A